MFAETRLIATAIVLVSIQSGQFNEVTIFRVIWIDFSFFRNIWFQIMVVLMNKQQVKTFLVNTVWTCFQNV